MPLNSSEEFPNEIALWVEGLCSPEMMEEIAKEARFNNKPLFGAKKRRMKLMEEVCCVNTAIAVHSVNRSFDPDDCKSIIDGVLRLLKKYMLGILEKHNPEFPNIYAMRMGEYFGILREYENPIMALSLAFLKNLHGKTKLDIGGQELIAARFSRAMTTGVNNMRSMSQAGSKDRPGKDDSAGFASGDPIGTAILNLIAQQAEAAARGERISNRLPPFVRTNMLKQKVVAVLQGISAEDMGVDDSLHARLRAIDIDGGLGVIASEFDALSDELPSALLVGIENSIRKVDAESERPSFEDIQPIYGAMGT